MKKHYIIFGIALFFALYEGATAYNIRCDNGFGGFFDNFMVVMASFVLGGWFNAALNNYERDLEEDKEDGDA